jgi:hypothetical protein
LLAHRRWFYPGTPVSSTTKTGRHDTDEILLKVALSTINQSNQSRLSTTGSYNKTNIQYRYIHYNMQIGCSRVPPFGNLQSRREPTPYW